jgi:hypothetical protein
MLPGKSPPSSEFTRLSPPVSRNSGAKNILPTTKSGSVIVKRYGIEDLNRDLKLLRRAWKRRQEAHDRFSVYRYLKAIYKLVWAWKAERHSDSRARRLLEVQKHSEFISPEPFGAVIFASSGGRVDPRHRSRWSRALRYAGRNRVPPRKLVWFLRQRGGVNACARLLKSRRRSHPI